MRRITNLITRKNGIWLIVIGAAMFLLNSYTLKKWNMDIDVIGGMIAVLGLVITIAGGNTMRSSSRLFTREKGIWLCIIGAALTAIIAFASFLGITNNGGQIGGIIFVIGIIVIIVGWNK